MPPYAISSWMDGWMDGWMNGCHLALRCHLCGCKWMWMEPMNGWMDATCQSTTPVQVRFADGERERLGQSICLFHVSFTSLSNPLPSLQAHHPTHTAPLHSLSIIHAEGLLQRGLESWGRLIPRLGFGFWVVGLGGGMHRHRGFGGVQTLCGLPQQESGGEGNRRCQLLNSCCGPH